MSWQEQRRLDKAAAAEQARQNALTAVQIEQMRADTRTQAEQARTAQRSELDRARQADRDARRDQARDRRKALWAGLGEWAAAHVVDLMIYPLAVVSAVMAVPAMAAFGFHVYGTAAGYALPVITELGMWAFAFAIHLVRHRSERDGQDRPVWALQTGVWSFAAVAAGLNFVHGLTAQPAGLAGGLLTGAVSVPPIAAGLVMAVASVAGVMAHQLVTAAPRRGRADRDRARIERRAAVKVAQVRKAAVRAAVAEIDDHGAARLVFRAGHYRLTRSRFAPWRRVRLDGAALPGLPVTPLPDGGDDLDRELAQMLAAFDPYPGTQHGPTTPTIPPSGGGVGTLDRDPATPDRPGHGDQRESASIDPGDTPADPPAKRTRAARKSARASGGKSGAGSSRAGRSIEELRTELHRLIEADRAAGRGSIDPGSAESIRRALRCSPARARQLRDTYRPADGTTD